MYSLFVLSAAVVAVTAVTPFFESPDNHKVSAFYKTPSQYHGPAPAPAAYKPAPAPYQPAPAPYKPAYQPEPAYKPAYKPAYQPEPAYKPAYQPEPAYKPAYQPEPAYKPSYKSEYSQGATSYQNVKLENGAPSSYKPSY